MKTDRVRRIVSLILLASAAPAVSAQKPVASRGIPTNLNGGMQSFVWSSDCTKTRLFKNKTNLPLAGLWVGIGSDGISNPPEIGTVSVHDPLAGRTWDVDDNEDSDNDDAGENDEIDSTPLGGSTGWHRVQARNNADVFGPDENFTLRLCDQQGGSLVGRRIFIVPLGKAQATGGDGSQLAATPIVLSSGAPTASISIGAGAPPGSNRFLVKMRNDDPALCLERLEITPPGGIGVLAAFTSGGGLHEPPNGVIWSPPLPLAPDQLDVTLDSLGAGTTVVGLEATDYVVCPAVAVPAIPLLGVAVLVLSSAIGGALLSRRRARTGLGPVNEGRG